MLYSHNRCTRCILTQRLTDLLTGPDGTVRSPLQPLIQSLTGVDNPATILIWLHHSTSARLLVQLAATDQPINHAVLDNLPPSKALYYVRDVLVTTGILPARDEHLERVTGFTDHLLVGVPAGHAAIIKPYTHWYLIRRARNRSRRRPTTKNSAAGLRASVRAALLLLIWLDNHQLTLATLTQPSLEDWLAANPTRQRYLQPFIAWTSRRRLTRGLVVPTAPRPEPHLFLTEHDRTDQLRRCLHDEDMPLEGRVAGTLLLLFGIPVSRLTQLTVDDVNNSATGTLLRIGTHRLQLPPHVADLLTLLVEHPRPTRSTLSKLAPNRWLFPGTSPTRPASQSQLIGTLRRNGINASAGRNTARAALASQLPSSVLADLTGIHIHTAVAWNRLAGSDWTQYVALRAEDGPISTKAAP